MLEAQKPYLLLQEILLGTGELLVFVTHEIADTHTLIRVTRVIAATAKAKKGSTRGVDMYFYSPIPGGEQSLCTVEFSHKYWQWQFKDEESAPQSGRLVHEVQAEVDYELKEEFTDICRAVLEFLMEQKVPTSNIQGIRERIWKRK